MLIRIWQLLERRERRRLLGLLPLVVLSAGIEIVGVSAVIPFLTLLADPAAIHGLPLVSGLVAASGVEDPVVLLRYAGVALALALLLMNTVVMITKYRLLNFSWWLNHTISTRLLGHYLAQPYAFTLRRNTAALTNKVVVEVLKMITGGVKASLDVLVASFTSVALLGFLVLLDPLLALIAFAVLGGLYGVIFAFARGYLIRIGRQSVRAGEARIKAVNEALGGFKELKVAAREGAALRTYARPSQRFAVVSAHVDVISLLPRHALEAVAVGGIVLVATLMAGREGTMAATLPLLGAYAFGGLRLLPAVQMLFSALARLRAVTGAVESIEADLTGLTEIRGSLDDRPEPPPFSERIELRGVSFRYPLCSEPALERVALTLLRGRSLAVVGGSGSGKTTLANVLLGLLEPDSGTVAVDGVMVAEAGRRSYRRLFGYVPQDIFLLDDTIRRNVALGLPDDEVDEEAVRCACSKAQVDDFIERELPRGYATVVGERGVRLSGGQRQRIGIARALYHEPPVLVFDEATSALDVHTERRVYEALEAIARTHTLVTIAHRLETVANADHVVVLEAGRVIDSGQPDAVLARYRQQLLW